MEIPLAPAIGIVVTTLMLVTTLLNRSSLKRPPESPWSNYTLPTLDVLIPARNEAHTIGRCLNSLLKQDYPNLTITILNDNSTDETQTIAEGIAASNHQVRVISGNPLPSGWTGKNWACHQLFLATEADLMLFSDADTWFKKGGIRRWVNVHLFAKADLTTLIPGRQATSSIESLVIGFINWFVLALLPLPIAYRVRTPLLSMTFGQFMLFSREAYMQIGGYQSIRRAITDDVSLGRRIKSHGLTWRLFDGSTDVLCAMYPNNRDLIYGIGRSIFPVLGYKTIYLIGGIIVLFSLGWLPLMVLLFDILSNPVENHYAPWAFFMVLSTGITWYLSQRQFHQPLWVMFCYPIAIAFMIFVGIHSAVIMRQGRSRWKGRVLSKPK